MQNKSHLRIRMLCEGALMVALAQVLSYVKLAEAPNGGSITPPCSPFCSLPSAGACAPA